MKILIAEDNSLMLKIIQKSLEKKGFEVITTIDGLDAIQKIEEHHPDVVILDIMMPFYSGLEIVSKLKQDSNKVRVIVISDMGQQSVVDEAMKLGADEYIFKPFSINTLVSNIYRITTTPARA